VNTIQKVISGRSPLSCRHNRHGLAQASLRPTSSKKVAKTHLSRQQGDYRRRGLHHSCPYPLALFRPDYVESSPEAERWLSPSQTFGAGQPAFSHSLARAPRFQGQVREHGYLRYIMAMAPDDIPLEIFQILPEKASADRRKVLRQAFTP